MSLTYRIVAKILANRLKVVLPKLVDSQQIGFIQSGKALVHQLFVDDTGVCILAKEEYFVELKEILAKYELGSGNSKDSHNLPWNASSPRLGHTGRWRCDGTSTGRYVTVKSIASPSVTANTRGPLPKQIIICMVSG
ncbi:hypothetical protein R1sor_014821 [Riccia sorocarpa]|uniref:Reverse transcriptase domain-containing protein n=1 Tax=Riccia sorocarpa TaxID=122646 RepID=A0ABD3HDG0_9MARC